MFNLPVGHCSNVRRCVVSGSLALALLGWGIAAWRWVVGGDAMGGDAAFVMALNLAATFSVAFVVAVVLPDKARLYAIGFRDGARFAEEHHADAPEPTRLRSVR